MRRSELRRMGHNEVDVVRSARPEGVKDVDNKSLNFFGECIDSFYESFRMRWMIHGPRLVQRQGSGS